jgi:hypothetical protein
MSLDQTTSDIDSANHLSIVTRHNLKSKVKRLFETKPFPKKISSKVLDQIVQKDSSRLAYLTAILSVMKVSPSFRALVGDSQRMTISREVVILKDKEEERKTIGETRKSDIAWEDLLKCEFPAGSEALLLHKLYTELPTMRADYTPVEIVKSKAQVVDDDMNYIVLGKKPVFILRSYKTAKTYGEQTFPIPQSVVDLLPRDQKYLFESAPGVPILANTLSKKITRAYERYCKIPMNINALRRSYSEHTSSLGPEERLDAAIAQGHSLSQHRQYAARG